MVCFYRCELAVPSPTSSLKTSSHGFQELVLVEKTRLSEQYFGAMQKLVVFDLGLTLLPVGGQAEASQLIAQIVSTLDGWRFHLFDFLRVRLTY